MHRFGNDDDMPDTGTPRDWATFEDEAVEMEPRMTGSSTPATIDPDPKRVDI
jgi:hypothetical protein